MNSISCLVEELLAFRKVRPRRCCLLGHLFLAVALSGDAFAQPFQNLGFEEANTDNLALTTSPDGPSGSGPISDLLPFWQLFQGRTPVTALNLNVTPVAGPYVYLSLVTSGNVQFGGVVEGRCALALSGPPEAPCP